MNICFVVFFEGGLKRIYFCVVFYSFLIFYYRDFILVVVINCGISVFVGFVIFFVFGFMFEVINRLV